MAGNTRNGRGVIPSDFDGSYCCYSVLWPSSEQWQTVLRQALIGPSEGRFWDAHTGIITDAQDVIRETFDNNLHLEEVFMSCNDASALSTALNAIALALSSQRLGGGSGCCNGGSVGGGEFPADPGGSDAGGLDPGSDPPPDGFPSWEVYDNQRCAVAREILDDVKLSLAHVSIIAVTGITIEGLVEILLVALTLTISSAGIAAIAALILTIGSAIVAATALSIINDNEDDLICALLSGTNSTTSLAAFRQAFSDATDAASVDIVEAFAMKQLINYLVEPAEINRMYTYQPGLLYQTNDCLSCLPDCLTGALVCSNSNVDSNGGGSGVVLSVVDGVCNYDTPLDLTDYPRVRIDFNHVIEAGDVFSFCFLDDPTPWGAVFKLFFDEESSVTLENAGTIVDHVAARCYSLEAFIGQHVTKFEYGFNRAGGGNWEITAIGFNCVCTEGASCFTPE